MTDQLHLKPKHRKMLEELLHEHLPDIEVWAYGSRVNGRSHDGSDLDIALRGPELKKIPIGSIADFNDALRESRIPFLVEASDWAYLPGHFRQEIERDHVVLTPSEKQKSTLPPTKKHFTRRMTLGDCVYLVRDIVQPTSVPNVPYIGLEHIGKGSLHLLGQGTSDEAASAKMRFRKGDTLFGKLRPYFRKVVRAPFNGICSTDIWVIRAKDGVDQRFIHYCLASEHFIDFVNSRSEGTRMPRASWKSASEYQIDLPPISEQRSIAHILGTLDDKIELNRRANRALEETARTVFKDWFVDFGPVKAKMNGREPYLPPEIWKLFPTRFVDADLGQIPEGWKIEHLEDEFEVIMGQSPPGHTYNDTCDGLPFFQGSYDFGFRYPTKRKFCNAPKRIVRPWDTVISVRAPVGDINMVGERCCIGRGLAALRPNSDAVSYGYYVALRLQALMREYESSGTVFGAINRKQLSQLSLLRPAIDVIEAFEHLVHPKDQEIWLNTAETATLIAIREALLPKLVSGQIHLEGARKVTGVNSSASHEMTQHYA